MNLTDRQKEIFSSVIQEYSCYGKPVSSKELIENYLFNYSPATIRSEMNDLEIKGLLRKPHTSAGRIPTEQGYRFYVNEVMQVKSLEAREKRQIKTKVNKIRENDDFSKELAEVLTGFSESLVLVGYTQEKHLFFSGLGDLFEKIDQDIFSHIVHFLEEAEKDFDSFYQESKEKPSVFIGEDHPLLRGAKCSLVLTRYKQNDDDGVIALLGPDRMNYEHNLSLLNYINELLN